MYDDLKGKQIVITGASRGIGLAAANAFAAAGGTVTAIASAESSFKGELADTITTMACDLSDPGAIASICQQIKAVDILVHNAGFFKTSTIVDTSEDIWERHLQVNTTAPFHLTRGLWPLLAKSKSANVIFVSSLAGVANIEKFATAGAYTTSKMAAVGLMEVVAAEGREINLRSNCISPGAVDTDMLRGNFPDFPPDFKPEDIAAFILFYASDISAPVSGTNVVIKKTD